MAVRTRRRSLRGGRGEASCVLPVSRARVRAWPCRAPIGTTARDPLSIRYLPPGVAGRPLDRPSGARRRVAPDGRGQARGASGLALSPAARGARRRHAPPARRRPRAARARRRGARDRPRGPARARSRGARGRGRQPRRGRGGPAARALRAGRRRRPASLLRPLPLGSAHRAIGARAPAPARHPPPRSVRGAGVGDLRAAHRGRARRGHRTTDRGPARPALRDDRPARPAGGGDAGRHRARRCCSRWT